LLTDADNVEYFKWLRGPEENTIENYMQVAVGFRLAIAMLEKENK
jgi:hypothetical protein